MSGTLEALALAMAAFVASHLALSSRPIRDRLVSLAGDTGFRAGYSLVAVALLVWTVIAYAEAPSISVWSPPVWLKWAALPLMLLSCFLIVAGYATRNPTAVGADTGSIIETGPSGVFRITRHPVMWGVALWGIAHLLASGDAGRMILFAGLTILALAGAAHSDARRAAALGEPWAAYRRRTSFIPMEAIVTRRTPLRFGEIGWAPPLASLALYALLLAAHPWLFGVSPVPGIG